MKIKNDEVGVLCCKLKQGDVNFLLVLQRRSQKQLAFFPELIQTPSLPSISTFPEFEKALDNLIKISDLGAFITVTVHGVEKSFTLNPDDLMIPSDYLKKGDDTQTSPIIHLFPHEINRQIRRLTYDLKSYFNHSNSFKTPFGYFLFRTHFDTWSKFIVGRKEKVRTFLENSLGGKKYSKNFLDAFTQGTQYLNLIKSENAPWEIAENISIQKIRESRAAIHKNKTTLHKLQKDTKDFPSIAVSIKTLHFPLDLHDYLDQLDLRFAFQTIYLEYLKDVTIRSIDDVESLCQKIGEKQTSIHK